MKPLHYSEREPQEQPPTIDWTVVAILLCAVGLVVAVWAFAIYGAWEAIR